MIKMDKRATEIKEEYLSSLVDLNVNSKPLINMLTILAEENHDHASVIVEAVEQHISKVSSDGKLPILYLIDSIVKNVGRDYKTLFSHCIINLFGGVFEKVNEKIREKMFNLRQTWNDVFQQSKLYALDVKINCMDPEWPITAKVATAIHVNPIFLTKNVPPTEPISEMQQKLRESQRVLLELKKKKLELELIATQKKIMEEEKKISLQTARITNDDITPKQNDNTSANKNSIPTLNSLAVGPQTSPKPKVNPVNPALINSLKSRDPRLQKNLFNNSETRTQPVQLSQNISATSRPINNNMNIHKTNSGPISVSNNMEDNDSKTTRFSSKIRNNNDTLSSSSTVNSEVSKKMKRSSASRSLTHKSNSSSSNYSSGKSGNSGRRGEMGTSKHSSSSNKSPSSRDGGSKRSSSDKKKRRTSPPAIPLSSSSVSKRSPSMSPSKSSSPRKKRDEFKSPSRKHSNSPTGNTASSPLPSQAESIKFKDVKASKNRNYINQNNRNSESPENVNKLLQQKDVDLRTLTGPPQPKKIMNPGETYIPDASLLTKDVELNSLEEQKTIFEASKDVDLRLLPPVPPAQSQNNVILAETASSSIEDNDEINKKRKSMSLEVLDEPSIKRTKSEKLDILFGSEDVDLRTLNAVPPMNTLMEVTPSKVENLTPPPPPIISNKVETTNWTKIKNNSLSDKRDKKSTIKSNLEAIRAKLAEASKTKDRLVRPLLYNKLPDNPIERKRKLLTSKSTLSAIPGNVESRIRNEDLLDDSSQDGLNTNINIIMAQAQEQLDSEKIDLDQYNNLVKQVIQINETQKIREAKRIERKNKESIVSTDNIAPEEVQHDAVLNENDSVNKNFSKNKIEDNKKNLNVELSYVNSTAADLRNINRGINNKSMSDNRKNKNESNSKFSPWESENWNFRLNVPNQPNNSTIGLRPQFGRNNFPNPWQSSAFENNVLRVQPTVTPNTAALSTTIINRNDDIMRTINIDGIAREIRFYDEISLIFMNWEEPKEIYFQMGTRKLTVDDTFSIELNFNDVYKSLLIDNKTYQIKLGSPTRELYIDKVWYECYFGDPAISIVLDDKIRIFKIDGPPPQVKIGNLRTDLVAGKISMIINAEITVPLFLDNKIQYFELDGMINTVQFGDYLLSVIINDEPISVEFGGLPKSILIRGKKHFVRFTGLPRNITPGRHFIKNMVRTNLYRDLKTPPKSMDNVNIDPTIPNHAATSATNVTVPLFNNFVGIPGISATTDSIPKPQINEIASSGIDYLTNLLSVPLASTSLNNTGYQIEQSESAINSNTLYPEGTKTSNVIPLVGNLNVDELFRKLLDTGILSNKDKAKEAEKKEKEKIVPVLLSHPETLKIRQTAIVNTLYSGMQCSSCGVRFPPEQTMKYSQHLDWHFRQNRRDRDSTRRAHSRKWYYDVSDWIQYEEIEDLEEREKNWFESQQPDDLTGEESNNKGTETPPPSCPAGQDSGEKRCDMCHDLFEQFYHEEVEEWHLRSAIQVEEKFYHPVCYEDYKASLTLDESALNITSAKDDTSDSSEMKIKKEKIDEDNEKIETDPNDDDVIELPAEIAEITEIMDEEDEKPEMETNCIEGDLDASNVATLEGQTEEHKTEDKNDSTTMNLSVDDDVQIQEPHIEITDLDLIDDIPANSPSSAPNDESSQMSQNSLFIVKIKEEPKDDGYEDEDAFEEVGTVENNIFYLNTEITTAPETTIDSSQITIAANTGGNMEIKDTPVVATTTAGSTNKIKINITKSNNKPLITNNTINMNENSNDNVQENDLPVEEGGNTIDGNVSGNNNINNNDNEEIDIEYELKPELKDVDLIKMNLIKNGNETSGLCSIM